MIISRWLLFSTVFIILFNISGLHAQTLGLYGGAGISGDRFTFNEQYVKDASSSFATGPIALLGLRYHTLQNFDVTLDVSIGITRIKVPVPSDFDGKLHYQQLQSLIMVGSGMNIPLEKANLMPFIQLGAGFYDFWELSTSGGKVGSQVLKGNADYNTNRWTIVCGAGVDYQFKLFLSSGINLRFVYTPLEVFNEPANVNISTKSGEKNIQLQGKFLQAQLTYRINLPLAKWKDDYDRR